MSAILSWVKQMIYLLIFLSMAQQILPNERYRRYLRFFCGLLFIVTLMKPVFSVFGTENWEEALYSQIDEGVGLWPDESDREDMQADFQEMEETQASLYQEYEERLTEELAE